MRLFRAPIPALLLVSSAALAQPYSVATQGAPFTPLVSGIQASLMGSSPNDNGRAVLPIGFAFPYYGRAYSQLVVTANGLAFLEPDGCAGCDYPQNGLLPNAAKPNAVLAPFWDDLRLAPTGGIFYATSSPDGGGVQRFTVEWRGLNHWFSTSQYSLTFQLVLSSNGELAFHYGPVTGAGAALSGTIGIESPDGLAAVAGKACAASCGFSDLTADQRITFSAPAQVELSVPEVLLDAVSAPDGGASLELVTTTTLRNFSQADAVGARYALFLSSDRLYQGGVDLPLLPSTQGPLEVPALGTASHTATSTVDRPDGGLWHVVAVADPLSALSEPDETNNAGASTGRFAATVDLLAGSVSGPSQSGPGETATVEVELAHLGVDALDGGLAPLAIWLSSDPALDAQDRRVHSAVVPLGPRQTVKTQLSFTVPTAVAAGSFHWLLSVDPDARVAEEDEGNNAAASSAQVAISQNDLEVLAVAFRDPAPPNDPLTRLFFGEPARFEVTVKNRGGAATQSANVQLFVSTNEQLNALLDTRFATEPLTLLSGQTRTVTLEVALPVLDRAGAPFGDGRFHILALASASSDADALNDIRGGPEVSIVRPAPDLVVRSLSTAPQLAAGERFLVSRRISNAGNRDAGVAHFRYLLSPNELVSPIDAELPLSDGGTPQVALAARSDSIAVDEVRVPEDLPAGDYHLSAIVDPAGQVSEFDEANNTLAGQRISVVGPALVLETQVLPDAIIDRPYVAQLTGRGGREPIRFTATGLPAGLSLSSAGALSGTPLQRGSYGVEVTLTSGARSARWTAVLRVLAHSSHLAVTTQALPPVQRELPYDFQLSAQGGALPYRWSLQGGSLPTGLELRPDGRLVGTTQSGEGLLSARVRVTDGLGTVDERELQLRVVSSAALILQTTHVPPALVGTEYAIDLYAVSSSGAPITATPLSWSVIEGELPPGLSLDPRDLLLFVRGVPRRAGLFEVVFEVRDAHGRRDSASVLFHVFAPSALLTAELPALVRPGEAVDGRIVSEGAGGFRVVDGALPSGLQLGTDGVLSGMVAIDCPAGLYAFTVTAVDAVGVARLGGFALEVGASEQAPSRTCGCGAAQLPPMLALLVLTATLRRRRRG